MTEEQGIELLNKIDALNLQIIDINAWLAQLTTDFFWLLVVAIPVVSITAMFWTVYRRFMDAR